MTENKLYHKNSNQTGQNNRVLNRNILSEKQFQKIDDVLNTLMLQAPGVICSFQWLDGKWDITYVSDTIEPLIGFEPNEIIGHFETWKKQVHPEDIDHLLADMQPDTTQENSQSFEYRFKNKQGNYQWLYDQRRVVAHKDGKIEILSALWDVTERRQVLDSLQQSEYRFQKMLSLVPDMISIQDSDMNIIYSNWSGLGEVPEEKRVLGSKCYQTYRGYDNVCHDCHAISVLHTKKGHREERKLSDGRWISLRVAPILDDNGNVEYFVEWIRDITERKQAEKKLEWLATTDDLTGLWNRRYFLNAGIQEIRRAKRYGQSFSILMLDIDNFKVCNDTHGHAAGDAVLGHLAGILKDSLRETDIAGRLGGEEFGILLPNTDIENAAILAERLRSVIEKKPANYAGKSLLSTVSIGAAAYHHGIGSIDDLLLLTDKALYEAKENGRNRVVNKIASE